MDIRLTVNGKEVSLSEEQIKLLGLEPERKKTGYERVGKGHIYYRLSGEMGVGNFADTHEKSDLAQEFYDVGNYFSDFVLAANVARATELIWQLQRFAAENGGIPTCEDWKNDSVCKYCIACRNSKEISVLESYRIREFGQVYFLDRDACRTALARFYRELNWYFTTYEPMLKSE